MYNPVSLEKLISFAVIVFISSLLAGTSVIPLTQATMFGNELSSNATCYDRVVIDTDSGLTRVTCRSRAFGLRPGEHVARVNITDLASPFPAEGMFDVILTEVEMVDSYWRPVPTSELFIHHMYTDGSYFPGASDLNYRHHPRSNPFEEGRYAFKVNASSVDPTQHLLMTGISLLGVVDPAECVQCWYLKGDHDWLRSDCARTNCAVLPDVDNSTTVDYYVVYAVFYRPSNEATERVLELMVESHQLVDDEEDGSDVSSFSFTIPNLDVGCPQAKPVKMLRCGGHFHTEMGLKMYDVATGNLICSSSVVYGTQEGVPGNELGFQVMTTTEHVSYDLDLASAIRVVVEYNNTLPMPEKEVGGGVFIYLGGVDTAQCEHFTNSHVLIDTALYQTRAMMPCLGGVRPPYKG